MREQRELPKCRWAWWCFAHKPVRTVTNNISPQQRGWWVKLKKHTLVVKMTKVETKESWGGFAPREALCWGMASPDFFDLCFISFLLILDEYLEWDFWDFRKALKNPKTFWRNCNETWWKDEAWPRKNPFSAGLDLARRADPGNVLNCVFNREFFKLFFIIFPGQCVQLCVKKSGVFTELVNINPEQQIRKCFH